MLKRTCPVSASTPSRTTSDSSYWSTAPKPVHSGELMSRSGSDIRAVQMYLSFGPSILVQCLIAVVAFGLLLSAVAGRQVATVGSMMNAVSGTSCTSSVRLSGIHCTGVP